MIRLKIEFLKRSQFRGVGKYRPMVLRAGPTAIPRNYVGRRSEWKSDLSGICTARGSATDLTNAPTCWPGCLRLEGACTSPADGRFRHNPTVSPTPALITLLSSSHFCRTIAFFFVFGQSQLKEHSFISRQDALVGTNTRSVRVEDCDRRSKDSQFNGWRLIQPR